MKILNTFKIWIFSWFHLKKSRRMSLLGLKLDWMMLYKIFQMFKPRSSNRSKRRRTLWKTICISKIYLVCWITWWRSINIWYRGIKKWGKIFRSWKSIRLIRKRKKLKEKRKKRGLDSSTLKKLRNWINKNHFKFEIYWI